MDLQAIEARLRETLWPSEGSKSYTCWARAPHTHTAKGRHMLAMHSFNALYQAAHQAPGMKNVRYLKM